MNAFPLTSILTPSGQIDVLCLSDCVCPCSVQDISCCRGGALLHRCAGGCLCIHCLFGLQVSSNNMQLYLQYTL